jgi:ribosomal protein L14
MIQKQTLVRVVDNSGAKKARVFFVYRPFRKAQGLGNKVLVSLRRVVPNNAKKLKKGDKLRALVVQQRRPHANSNTCYYCKSFFNSVVILKKGDENLPLGTRIYVKISKFARFNGFNRLFFISRGLI